MLSKMCRIAIRAVIFLSKENQQKQYISLKEIAEGIDSSLHTVGKIMQALVHDKIVGSLKGPNGGFYINDQQKELPIMKIVVAIEGYDNFFSQCGLGLHKCSAQHPCPIHVHFEPAKKQIERLFTERKVGELSEVVGEGDAFLKG